MAMFVRKYPKAFDNTQYGGVAPMIVSSDQTDKLGDRAPDSATMLPYWTKVSDIIDGADCVKSKAEYLPRFPNELTADYEFRLKTAIFTNIYGDIIEDLSSKPFEEEVSFSAEQTVPEQYVQFSEDVDGSGNNLTVFASDVFYYGIANAVHWIFVDYPDVATDPNRPRSRLEEQAGGIKPYWSHVLGKNVLEVRWTKIGGKEEITYMRVLEYEGTLEHVRVMAKDASGARWELYEKRLKKNSSQAEYVLIGSGVFTIGIIPLVPFVTGRRKGNAYIYKPPLKDAVEMQLELYDAESSLKFAKKLVAFPMLTGNGVNPMKGPDGVVLAVGVGPGRVLFAPPDGNGGHGEWAFIEPAATSLTFLSGDIEKMKNTLRELGKQPLTAQSGNLTVITTAVAAGKARSAVGAWGLSLKNALENAFKITGMWMNNDFEPELKIYDEYDDFSDSGADLATLQAARTARDISQLTYWEELKRRRVLSAEFDPETETQRILDETPSDPVDGGEGAIDDPAADGGKPAVVPVKVASSNNPGPDI